VVSGKSSARKELKLAVQIWDGQGQSPCACRDWESASVSKGGRFYAAPCRRCFGIVSLKTDPAS